jgi:hypothetical protein
MFKEGLGSERAFRMASKICGMYGIQVSDIGRDFVTTMESVFRGVETDKDMQGEIVKAFRAFQRVLDGGGLFTHAIEAAKQEVRGDRGEDVDLLRDTGFLGQFGALKPVDDGDALDSWLDEEDFGADLRARMPYFGGLETLLGVQADPMGGAAGAGVAGADLFTIGEQEED